MCLHEDLDASDAATSPNSKTGFTTRLAHRPEQHCDLRSSKVSLSSLVQQLEVTDGFAEWAISLKDFQAQLRHQNLGFRHNGPHKTVVQWQIRKSWRIRSRLLAGALRTDIPLTSLPLRRAEVSPEELLPVMRWKLCKAELC